MLKKEYTKTKENIEVYVNENLSEKGQALVTAHELLGHAYLNLKGQPSNHDRTVTPAGIRRDLNSTLRQEINKSTSVSAI
jgi:Zn-dependent peptidase ImmA (M78 family)